VGIKNWNEWQVRGGGARRRGQNKESHSRDGGENPGANFRGKRVLGVVAAKRGVPQAGVEEKVVVGEKKKEPLNRPRGLLIGIGKIVDKNRNRGGD